MAISYTINECQLSVNELIYFFITQIKSFSVALTSARCVLEKSRDLEDFVFKCFLFVEFSEDFNVINYMRIV